MSDDGYEVNYFQGRYRVTASVTFDLDFFISRNEGTISRDTLYDPESDERLVDSLYWAVMRELQANGLFSAEYSIEVEDEEPDDEEEEEEE